MYRIRILVSMKKRTITVVLRFHPDIGWRSVASLVQPSPSQPVTEACACGNRQICLKDTHNLFDEEGSIAVVLVYHPHRKTPHHMSNSAYHRRPAYHSRRRLRCLADLNECRGDFAVDNTVNPQVKTQAPTLNLHSHLEAQA